LSLLGKLFASSRPYRADAIVVLGRSVNVDGSLGLIARARVDRALQLFEMGVAPRIIFTGKCGLMSETRPAVTEAAAMARHARANGLPPTAVMLEERAQDTIGNAYFVRTQWLDPNGWTSIRIVTSDFHVPRAAWVFGKVLGSSFDLSYSPASSERFGRSVGVRAREESDIARFLSEWLGHLPDGDVEAFRRFITEQHPAYSAHPAMTKAQLRDRVDEISRSRRAEESRQAPAIMRPLSERLAEL
jgi:uncharacterized SAM-binding protein YcdF (DUF218 family)